MEAKMTAAAKAAAAGAGVVSPLVLYVMVRVLGDDATDPLAIGASAAVAFVLVGGVALLVGYRTPSTTSVVSDAFDPTAAGYNRAGAGTPQRPQEATRSAVRPPAEAPDLHVHEGGAARHRRTEGET